MALSSAEAATGFRCIAIVDLVTEDALETNQQAWRSDDPFLVLRGEGVRRYVRALSQRHDNALFRPRSRLGAAEFWVDDEATALAIHVRLRDRALRKAHPALRDARLTLLANREIAMIGDGPERTGEGLKALFINARKPGMPVADYQDYWLNVHGPMVHGVPGLSRYTQFHRLPASYEGDDTPFDGGAEMSWPDAAAYEAYGRAEDYQARFREDMPNLWDLRAGIRFFVKEEEVFDDR